MANTTQTYLYGTAQSLTLSLAALANAGNAGRESTTITVGNYSDHVLYLKIPTTTATTAGNDKAVYVYLHNSPDNTVFVDQATGTDAAITFQTPTNFTLARVISCVTNNTYNAIAVIPSVRAVFSGNMPFSYGVVVQNNSGLTFNATEANIVKQIIPVTYVMG